MQVGEVSLLFLRVRFLIIIDGEISGPCKAWAAEIAHLQFIYTQRFIRQHILRVKCPNLQVEVEIANGEGSFVIYLLDTYKLWSQYAAASV